MSSISESKVLKELIRDDIDTALKVLNINSKMTFDEFNRWLLENGLEKYDIEKQKRLFEIVFKSVSINDESKRIENWQDFFIQLEEVTVTNPESASALIADAIKSEPEFDVLIEILNRGYTFDGNHVAMLASNLDLEKIQRLENYSVDLNVSSSAGTNALISSLFNSEDRSVFEYFLSKDRLVFSEDIDVLKEVLDTSSLLGLDVFYAKQLLDRGVEVKNETRLWIESDLKQEDYDFYLKVKDSLSI